MTTFSVFARRCCELALTHFIRRLLSAALVLMAWNSSLALLAIFLFGPNKPNNNERNTHPTPGSLTALNPSEEVLIVWLLGYTALLQAITQIE